MRQDVIATTAAQLVSESSPRVVGPQSPVARTPKVTLRPPPQRVCCRPWVAPERVFNLSSYFALPDDSKTEVGFCFCDYDFRFYSFSSALRFSQVDDRYGHLADYSPTYGGTNSDPFHYRRSPHPSTDTTVNPQSLVGASSNNIRWDLENLEREGLDVKSNDDCGLRRD